MAPTSSTSTTRRSAAATTTPTATADRSATPLSSAANQWYHVVGSYDGTTMRLYVNGVKVREQVSPATTNVGWWSSTQFFVGSGGGPSAGFGDNEQHHFKGVIDDVAYYTYP